MDVYNRDKLVKITAIPACPSVWYHIRRERKIMGFRIQKEGIYESIYGGYLGDKAPVHHFIKGWAIYEKPKVILRYQAGHKKTYYFDTYDEAIRFKDEIVSVGTWLE